jgi:cytochrome c2
MPDFRFSEERIDELVTTLLAFAAKETRAMGTERQLVNFAAADRGKTDIFSKKCGGCHKALTGRSGALGAGGTAPDLSGLFSGHYPKKSPEDAGWNRAALEKWLRNPRTMKREAAMQPVAITAAELQELVRTLGHEPTVTSPP